MEKRDTDRLQEEIAELFADLWQVPRFAHLRHGFRPQVDCFRTDDPAELTVVVELPGVEPGDVVISATPQRLVVTGERRRPKTPGRRYQQAEIDYGPFQRDVRLDEEVDTERAKATFHHGLLTIVLPVADRPVGAIKVPIDVRTER